MFRLPLLCFLLIGVAIPSCLAVQINGYKRFNYRLCEKQPPCGFPGSQSLRRHRGKPSWLSGLLCVKLREVFSSRDVELGSPWYYARVSASGFTAIFQ